MEQVCETCRHFKRSPIDWDKGRCSLEFPPWMRLSKNFVEAEVERIDTCEFWNLDKSIKVQHDECD